MTSSLVGSEMCIRDRSKYERVLKSMCRMLGQRQRTDLVRAVLYQGASAVSYTHLTLPTICSV
eukprot:361651-Prorocentrum_lima.AAC.1